MDIMQNLKAFLAVERTGSFSAAARQAGLATSVLAKRVDQLEAAIRTKLFVRTTRRLILTDAGRQWLTRVRTVVGDLEDLLTEPTRLTGDLEGSLRVKAPTSLAVLYVGAILGQFQTRHPRITMDIVLTDRPLNPAAEGFDLAISVFGASFSSVVDVPLCPLRRTLCATPAYLVQRGTPVHPRDLGAHDTLNFAPTGPVWMFDSATGPVAVDVQPRLSANDGQMLLAAALAGNGIALLSSYIARPALLAGALVPVLERFPLPQAWIKLLIPDNRMPVPRVRALADFLAASFDPPPWDQPQDQPPNQPQNQAQHQAEAG